MAGKFVEFFGAGVSQLSAPDRTTIANMCPEYSATISFFPIDAVTLQHFKKTRESPEWRSLSVLVVWSLLHMQQDMFELQQHLFALGGSAYYYIYCYLAAT